MTPPATKARGAQQKPQAAGVLADPQQKPQAAGVLADAIAAEQALADEAAALRGEETAGLTRDLLLKLLPLLRRPIPPGFITQIGKVTGKPYDSTGIKSVQVQIDRMDNILTPLGWRHTTEYLLDGCLAHVTVQVLSGDGTVLFDRDSRGGVDRASTIGNRYKGSYTNAAKRAFAMVGPGHEVYLGATDLDPDVNTDAAKNQEEAPTARAGNDPTLTSAQRDRVLAAFQQAGIVEEGLQIYLTAAGLDSPEKMTAAHAFKLRELLDEEIARRAAETAEADAA